VVVVARPVPEVMNLQRFDLNLLVALDALLTEKNVTRAGRRMNLSQSAMSGALARLRGFFQDELLVAVGRSMVLTPLADDLVQPLRDVLLQVHGTITTKTRFDPASSKRHFSIAVSDYVTSVLMIDLLRHVKAEAPTITFELRPIGQPAGEHLERGDLEFPHCPGGVPRPGASRRAPLRRYAYMHRVDEKHAVGFVDFTRSVPAARTCHRSCRGGTGRQPR